MRYHYKKSNLNLLSQLWRKKGQLFHILSVASVAGNLAVLAGSTDWWAAISGSLQLISINQLGASLHQLLESASEVLLKKPVLGIVLNLILFPIVLKSGLLEGDAESARSESKKSLTSRVLPNNGLNLDIPFNAPIQVQELLPEVSSPSTKEPSIMPPSIITLNNASKSPREPSSMLGVTTTHILTKPSPSPNEPSTRPSRMSTHIGPTEPSPSPSDLFVDTQYPSSPVSKHRPSLFTIEPLPLPSETTHLRACDLPPVNAHVEPPYIVAPKLPTIDTLPSRHASITTQALVAVDDFCKQSCVTTSDQSLCTLDEDPLDRPSCTQDDLSLEVVPLKHDALPCTQDELSFQIVRLKRASTPSHNLQPSPSSMEISLLSNHATKEEGFLTNEVVATSPTKLSSTTFTPLTTSTSKNMIHMQVLDDFVTKQEFNERVENFIFKFKRNLTMQRQESVNRLLSLIGTSEINLNR